MLVDSTNLSTYLLRLGPLLLGQVTLQNRALHSTTEAVGTVVRLALGQTRESLRRLALFPSVTEPAQDGAPIHSTYLLHLLVLLDNKVLVLEAHLTVTSGVRVRVRNRLDELQQARRRLNKVHKRNRLLQRVSVCSHGENVHTDAMVTSPPTTDGS